MLRPRCEACGLDYAFIDSGDGPAVFVILLAGFVVVGCALVVEFKYAPPFWLHAVLWGPLILRDDAAAAAPDEGPDDRAAVSPQGRRRPDGIGRAMTVARAAKRLLIPGVVALAGFVVLLGLGTWQLERKAWKENLIDDAGERGFESEPGRIAAARRLAAARARRMRNSRASG